MYAFNFTDFYHRELLRAHTFYCPNYLPFAQYVLYIWLQTISSIVPRMDTYTSEHHFHNYGLRLGGYQEDKIRNEDTCAHGFMGKCWRWTKLAKNYSNRCTMVTSSDCSHISLHSHMLQWMHHAVSWIDGVTCWRLSALHVRRPGLNDLLFTHRTLTIKSVSKCGSFSKRASGEGTANSARLRFRNIKFVDARCLPSEMYTIKWIAGTEWATFVKCMYFLFICQTEMFISWPNRPDDEGWKSCRHIGWCWPRRETGVIQRTRSLRALKCRYATSSEHFPLTKDLSVKRFEYRACANRRESLVSGATPQRHAQRNCQWSRTNAYKW